MGGVIVGDASSDGGVRTVLPRLVGGLGNQLFQVAAAHAYARRTHRHVVLPRAIREGSRHTLYGDRVFTSLRPLGWIEGWRPRVVHREPSFAYAPIPEMPAPRVELAGYFQSEKYFETADVEAVVAPSPALRRESDAIVDGLRRAAGGAPLVAVHVRRGDYRKNPRTHPIQSSAYYAAALEHLPPRRQLVLFSDELEDCRHDPLFRGALPVDARDDVSLFVMASCDHHVIANSTFSWWGAYLARARGGRVVAPGRWFGPDGPQDTGDLLPPDWVVVDADPP